MSFARATTYASWGLAASCLLGSNVTLSACAERGAEHALQSYQDSSLTAAGAARIANDAKSARVRRPATRTATESEAESAQDGAAAAPPPERQSASAAPAATNATKAKAPASPKTKAPDVAADGSLEEDCAERRVSYSTPCHDDPDPCSLASGWAGDEYCWPAPAKGEGIQIHIGPKDYDDPAELAKYTIEPGQEFNNSVLGHVPLSADRWYKRTMVRMRPGSHHWIATLVHGKPEERFYPEGDQNCGSDTILSTFSGGQTLIYDNPPGGVAAPENEGLGARLAGDSSLCVNLHAYNFSDHPQLREMWINVYFVDEAEVTQRTETIGIVGGLALRVPPGSKRTLTYSQRFEAPGRIVQLFGHRHVWTPRFAAWLNDQLIYDSFSWQESAVFNYDSITENPAPKPASKTDGAYSGELDVAAGDRLRFSCFIENDSDQTLFWRNELRAGEMCNLWGQTVGRGSGLSAQLQ